MGQKVPFFLGDFTVYPMHGSLGPSEPIIIPNGISISSSVFVWLANVSIKYNTQTRQHRRQWPHRTPYTAMRFNNRQHKRLHFDDCAIAFARWCQCVPLSDAWFLGLTGVRPHTASAFLPVQP